MSYGATNSSAFPSSSPNAKDTQETEGVHWTQFSNDYSIDSRSRIFLSLQPQFPGNYAFSPDAGDLVGALGPYIATNDIWI